MEHRTERIKRLRRVVGTNAGLLVYAGVSAVLTGNGAFWGEMLHDGGDTATQGSRYVAEQRGIDQHSKYFLRFRKASFFIIGSISAMTAAKLGWDFLQHGVEHESIRQEIINVTGGGVVAAGNVYAYTQAAAIEEHSHASHDAHNHALTDAAASVGLATTLIAEPFTWEGLSQVGGIGFSAYTALHMFVHGARAGNAETEVYCSHG